MPAIAVVVAEFIADEIVAVGAALTAATGVAAFGTLGVELGAVAANAIAALGFAQGVGAGIGAWATAAAIAEVALYKPSVPSAGQTQNFKADPFAAIDFIAGRFGVGGKIAYQTTSGGSNKYGAAGNKHLTNVVIQGALGPYQGFESLRVNDTFLTFGGTAGQSVTGGKILAGTFARWASSFVIDGGGNAINNKYDGCMWQNYQLGAMSGPALTQPVTPASDSPVPEWTAAHKLSGFCAVWWDCEYNNGTYSGGLPKPIWVWSCGYPTYDPRQDSTYPGGAGTQRWADRTTWGYSFNPWIHALNYALGFFLPDPTTGQPKLYAGIGAGLAGVNIANFVAAANVADANGWTIGGQWTSKDGKWAVLTTMCQAGGGQPINNAGIIDCVVSAPQTSVFTIEPWMLSGQAITVDTTTTMRDRINTVFPRFISEPHMWTLTPLVAPIIGGTYVTEDGAERSRQLDYNFVTSVNQCAQLAAYDMANSREGIIAVIPGKPILTTCSVGQCVTVDLPDAGLSAFKMIVTKRELDFKTGGITLTLQSETDAKHAFALGVSGVAPATPSITGVDPTIVFPPITGQWSAAAVTVADSVTGESTQIARITGSADDNPYANLVVIYYSQALTFDLSGDPLTWGPVSQAHYPPTTTTIDLDLNAGVWNLQVGYVTQKGGISETNLDLGNLTLGGSTSSATVTIGGYSAAEVANINVPMGVNVLINSELQGGNPPASWAWATFQTFTGSVTRAIASGEANAMFGTTAAVIPTGDVFDLFIPAAFDARYLIPVRAGNTIGVGAAAAYLNAAGVAIEVQLLDESFSYVTELTTAAGGANVDGSAVNLASYGGLGGIFTVPADGALYGGVAKNCRWAWFNARVVGNGSANAKAWVAHPLLAKLQAGQTSLPAYTPGPTDREADKTSENTSAAITGQGPWATTSTPVASVLTPSPNLVYNPSGLLGLDGWTQSGLTFDAYIGAGDGPYIQLTSGNNATYGYLAQTIKVYGGDRYSISAEIYTYGLSMTSGTYARARVFLNFYDASNTFLGSSAVCYLEHGNVWTRVTADNSLAPASATYAVVVLDIYGDGAYANTNCTWRKIKVELNTVDTPFSDDATYGATYADGTAISQLQPAQAGATKNVVTYQNSAPTSPTDGDVWFDTSKTPSVMNLRFGGAWIIVSTYNGLFYQADDPTGHQYVNGVYTAGTFVVPDGAIWINPSTGAEKKRFNGHWVGSGSTSSYADGDVVFTGFGSGTFTFPAGYNLHHCDIIVQGGDGGDFAKYEPGIAEVVYENGGSGETRTYAGLAVTAGVTAITYACGASGGEGGPYYGGATPTAGGDSSVSAPIAMTAKAGGPASSLSTPGTGGTGGSGGTSSTAGTNGGGGDSPGHITIIART